MVSTTQTISQIKLQEFIGNIQKHFITISPFTCHQWHSWFCKNAVSNVGCTLTFNLTACCLVDYDLKAGTLTFDLTTCCLVDYDLKACTLTFDLTTCCLVDYDLKACTLTFDPTTCCVVDYNLKACTLTFDLTTRSLVDYNLKACCLTFDLTTCSLVDYNLKACTLTFDLTTCCLVDYELKSVVLTLRVVPPVREIRSATPAHTAGLRWGWSRDSTPGRPACRGCTTPRDSDRVEQWNAARSLYPGNLHLGVIKINF